MTPGQFVAAGAWGLLVVWLIWEFRHAEDEAVDQAMTRRALECDAQLEAGLLISLDESRTPPAERRRGATITTAFDHRTVPIDCLEVWWQLESFTPPHEGGRW